MKIAQARRELKDAAENLKSLVDRLNGKESRCAATISDPEGLARYIETWIEHPVLEAQRAIKKETPKDLAI